MSNLLPRSSSSSPSREISPLPASESPLSPSRDRGSHFPEPPSGFSASNNYSSRMDEEDELGEHEGDLEDQENEGGSGRLGKACGVCKKKIPFYRRKHLCASCGTAVCRKCSEGQGRFKFVGKRLCNNCRKMEDISDVSVSRIGSGNISKSISGDLKEHSSKKTPFSTSARNDSVKNVLPSERYFYGVIKIKANRGCLSSQDSPISASGRRASGSTLPGAGPHGSFSPRTPFSYPQGTFLEVSLKQEGISRRSQVCPDSSDIEWAMEAHMDLHYLDEEIKFEAFGRRDDVVFPLGWCTLPIFSLSRRKKASGWLLLKGGEGVLPSGWIEVDIQVQISTFRHAIAHMRNSYSAFRNARRSHHVELVQFYGSLIFLEHSVFRGALLPLFRHVYPILTWSDPALSFLGLLLWTLAVQYVSYWPCLFCLFILCNHLHEGMMRSYYKSRVVATKPLLGPSYLEAQVEARELLDDRSLFNLENDEEGSLKACSMSLPRLITVLIKLSAREYPSSVAAFQDISISLAEGVQMWRDVFHWRHKRSILIFILEACCFLFALVSPLKATLLLSGIVPLAAFSPLQAVVSGFIKFVRASRRAKTKLVDLVEEAGGIPPSLVLVSEEAKKRL